MCTSSSKLSPCRIPLCVASSNQQPSKGHNLRYHRLNRRRRRLSQQTKKKGTVMVNTQMEMKNLELYMENKSIIQENEKLRKKAFLLHQENQALLYQLQDKFSSPPNYDDNLADHNNKNHHL